MTFADSSVESTTNRLKKKHSRLNEMICLL